MKKDKIYFTAQEQDKHDKLKRLATHVFQSSFEVADHEQKAFNSNSIFMICYIFFFFFYLFLYLDLMYIYKLLVSDYENPS